MSRRTNAGSAGARSRLAVLVAALSAALGLPACGGDDGARADAAEESTDAGDDARADETDADSVGDADAHETSPDDAGADDGASADIVARLASIPGMTVTDLGRDGLYRDLELTFRQPVDHANPDGPSFEQYMTLAHLSETAPLVLMTEGYENMFGYTPAEVALLVRGNQLVVEHRYCGRSVPDPVDWRYLTIAQAAADDHRIVQALRPIYVAAWLSTGYSKGGMTAVYHRRFYPGDVDGTVPYVAPISFGAPDPRYVDFVAADGDPLCRDRLFAVQREALVRRDALASHLDPALFGRIGGVDAAIDSVLLDFPLSFWQYLGTSYCSSIPIVPGASDAQLYSFIDLAIGFASASDTELARFGPYYYQAWSQLGFPDVERDRVADVLRTAAPSVDEGVLPVGAPTPTYDPTAMADIADWVATEGSRLLFIYGEYDPWSAGAFELGAAVDSFRLIVPQGTHMSGIADLPDADRTTAYDALHRWTGVVVHSLPREMIPRPRLPRMPPGLVH